MHQREKMGRSMKTSICALLLSLCASLAACSSGTTSGPGALGDGGGGGGGGGETGDRRLAQVYLRLSPRSSAVSSGRGSSSV